jgi:hypothetical protein
MRKLKLDLDQLTVDSFDTIPSEEPTRGTVEAHSHLCVSPFETCVDLQCPTGTCGATCATCASCDSCNATCYTCYNTCGDSCQGTCVSCLTECEPVSCVYYCP